MEQKDESKIDDAEFTEPPIVREIHPPNSSGTAGLEAITTPGTWDILCGRGKSAAHPGNQRFRQIIQSRRDEYQRAVRRDDKTKITFEIVESLRNGPNASR